MKKKDKYHILFLFSDTGGGHRSASEAIIEALNLEYPGRFTTEMVDFFRDYAPPPFNAASKTYAHMADFPNIWGLGYHLSNSPRRIRAMATMIWPYIRRGANQLIADHPCDLYVSVHPMINAPLLSVLQGNTTPFITVVTDLVSTHALWFNPKADLVIVPTEPARRNGIRFGLREDQIIEIGLPVSDRFCHPVENKDDLRQQMGWQDARCTVLMVAGGDGMGPMYQTAQAINDSGLDVSLVLVTGRNRQLMNRLEAIKWRYPAYIHGFVHEMPRFMRAADILITKAGPGTISEAFIAGLPMILYSYMPGQEDGNIDYAVSRGAGVWAPNPDLVVKTLEHWVHHPEDLMAASNASKDLAKPLAARMIAQQISRCLCEQ